MSRTYARPFKVRHYECNAYGRLYPSNFLKYMQEAAYEASADAGFDMVAYERSGKRWFVRESHIEYLHPVHYAEQVIVRTWVQDFHRVRSIRAYELSTPEHLAARAWSDWVYLDAETLMPESVPAEMVQAFMLEETRPVSQPRNRFPRAPQMPQDWQTFTAVRQVDWRDLDPAHHVNNSNYLVYIQEAHLLSLEALGWPVARLEEAGIEILPRSHHIEYRVPALYGDHLEIQALPFAVEADHYSQYHTLRRSGEQELIARNQAVYQCLRLKDERLCQLPDELQANLTMKGIS